MVREDKLLLGCQRYIAETLGAAFIQPQPWTMDSILPDTNPLTPTIFILTSGADPTAMLLVLHHASRPCLPRTVNVCMIIVRHNNFVH